MKSEIVNIKRQDFNLKYNDLEVGNLYCYTDKFNNQTGVVLACLDYKDSDSPRLVEINGDDECRIWDIQEGFSLDYVFKEFDGTLELSND